MLNQSERAQAFAALHVKGDPLVLFNAWDAGSAGVIAKAGAKAIGTGSWSVAMAHGFGDGELLPLTLVLANLARIVTIVELPVTLDLEGGYARDPGQVAENVGAAIDHGAIGINFEDGVVNAGGLYPIDEQVGRLRAARSACKRRRIPAFINARTDLFLQSPNHDDVRVDQAIERGLAYADAGASGFFVPGLTDEALIARICAAVPLPVNVMASPKLPARDRLAAAGVARISYGPQPYRLAMGAVDAAARAALSGGAT